MHVTYVVITILAALANGYAASLSFAGAESVKLVADKVQVSSTATVSGDPAGTRWVTMRSARANPSASLDQRALVNNRCARL